jgi:hypothetical protein
MTREERLQKIALDLAEISEENKQNKKEREGLMSDFFRLLDAGYKGREYLLPIKTIEVPDTFWTTTGMSKEEFIDTRFPGWKVQHVEKNIATNQTVFILKKDVSYLSAVVEVEHEDGQKIKVAKEVAEYTPEIDWETLNAERPDLFEKLAHFKTVVELDDAALERIAMETPEELATLERHMVVKTPALKVTSRRVKDDTKK